MGGSCSLWRGRWGDGFKVSKPWGDSSAYDVGVECGERILKIQVKSTDCRMGTGYLCGFKPNEHSERYTIKKVDFFAAYVIPENVWYVLPAGVVLETKSMDLMICPVQKRKYDRYRYEEYRNAWGRCCCRLRPGVPSAKDGSCHRH